MLVATSGCFDIFHDAHVNLLKACRLVGDTVVVFLNSDDSVSRIKGNEHPRMPLYARKAVLDAIKYVDSVVVFDEDTPAQALRKYRKHIGDTSTFAWMKGADARIKGLPDEEKNAVIESGGVILFYDNPSNTHATEIHGHIKRSHKIATEIQEVMEDIE